MADRSDVDTLAQLAQFETIGMPTRNLATRTRSEYSRDLRDLLSYLAQQGTTQLDEVRPQALEGYRAELDRRGLKGSTRNRKTHTLKTSSPGWSATNSSRVVLPHDSSLRRQSRRRRATSRRRNTVGYCGPAAIAHVMPQSSRCSCKQICAFPSLPRSRSLMLFSPSALRATSSRWVACVSNAKVGRSSASR